MQSVHEPQSVSSGDVGSISHVRDERAEHDPGAEPAGDQHRVLAVEADAGARRALAVDVLVRVHEHAVGAAETRSELAELLAQLRVRVVPRVARQSPLARPRFLRRHVVAQRGRDHRPRFRQQPLGMARDLGLGHREAHVGEQASRATLGDRPLRLLVGSRRRRADRVDPELRGVPLELSGSHRATVAPVGRCVLGLPGRRQPLTAGGERLVRDW